MIPNVNPKQMEKMMKQMGINSRQVNAKRVIIEGDGENLIITEPQVTEITMQGQKSFQISGVVSAQASIKDEDVSMVMEQASCTREMALAALEKSNGDIAQAIMELKKE